MITAMQTLVSASEGARQVGVDYRTLRKVIHLVPVRAETKTGKLYFIEDIRQVMVTRHDQRCIALSKIN
jgi:hypothetical protein